MMNKLSKIALILFLFAAFSCEKGKKSDPQDENRRVSVEIEKDGMDIQKIYPNAAYRNLRYGMKHFEDGRFMLNDLELSKDEVDKLKSSLVDGMSPSDRDYGCGNTDKSSKLRIAFETPEGKKVVAESLSHCREHIPWNITIDGKRHIQFNPEFSRKILAYLRTVDPEKWKDTQLRDGRIAFTFEGSDIASDSPAAQAAGSLRAYLSSLLREGERYEAEFYCDTAMSPTCEIIAADVSVRFVEKAAWHFSAKVRRDGAAFSESLAFIASDLASARVVSASKMAASFVSASKSESAILEKIEDKEGACDALHAAWQVMKSELPPKDLSCARWLVHVSGTDLPKLVYYPEISAAWLTEGEPPEGYLNYFEKKGEKYRGKVLFITTESKIVEIGESE